MMMMRSTGEGRTINIYKTVVGLPLSIQMIDLFPNRFEQNGKERGFLSNKLMIVSIETSKLVDT